MNLPRMACAAVLVGLAVHVPWRLLQFKQLAQEVATTPSLQRTEYFYNEVTGEVQWVDPGDTPYEDQNGVRYWIDLTKQRWQYNPFDSQYVWVEQYSEELKRSFYYNQVKVLGAHGQLDWPRIA